MRKRPSTVPDLIRDLDHQGEPDASLHLHSRLATWRRALYRRRQQFESPNRTTQSRRRSGPHQNLRHQDARLVRNARDTRSCIAPRKADQTLAPRMERRADHGSEPGLAGYLFRNTILSQLIGFPGQARDRAC